MKRKKHSILSYLVRREYGQRLRGDGRDLGHLFVEDKATDPAVNKVGAKLRLEKCALALSPHA
jgi:hypothetical protein